MNKVKQEASNYLAGDAAARIRRALDRYQGYKNTLDTTKQGDATPPDVVDKTPPPNIKPEVDSKLTQSEINAVLNQLRSTGNFDLDKLSAATKKYALGKVKKAVSDTLKRIQSGTVSSTAKEQDVKNIGLVGNNILSNLESSLSQVFDKKNLITLKEFNNHLSKFEKSFLKENSKSSYSVKVQKKQDNTKSIVEEMIKSFFPYAKERMGFDKDPTVIFRTDSTNSKDPYGKTAYYDPENMQIVLYIVGRHPKDILRSYSHELVHHTQNCRGDFNVSLPTGEGYAQSDDHLREMEREAYEQGNLVFRDFEDGKKTGKLMESNTKKIEKEIADAKRNRGSENTKEIQKSITDTLVDRSQNLNNELMRRWGFNKPQKNDE